MFADLPVRDFLNNVASGEPTPGGGSVSALCGALSAALAEMVARITAGKTNDEVVAKKMAEILNTASKLRKVFAENIDRDSAAYAAVMKAYKMPKETDREKKERQKAVQEALKDAAQIPLEVAEMGLRALSLAETLVKEGNQNAVTDAAVGALIARSAVVGALYNVRINLLSIKDATFRDRVKHEAEQIEHAALAKERDILTLASSVISG
ncbi:MAG TPA: cyclodeaminase/cyclohydrolase family protein [Syntrophorhabdus sp.]|jgi:formiminotetrahydrofolate cyclodeaminase|nr:cyclodeaminase/cyclohydrolase family protein [Syntrophorhabdus sp.]MDI9558654.1 cyclodeaminase/cyclohydrolase family protein [Pseudomonadota bacterium]OQB76559.1 MAG: Methenyltetrahydrofolate cyclohydrolase [Deltaproteobacteria bacterium ADurb.Bin135]HNY70427.1 cyclodeaminase/cyclohydrolase family protein [Syntrophorhabdus sp.]HOH27358.1 cyclodeaminase/cyclohydrolase family protein [Syntrophorhabdus sp.]